MDVKSNIELISEFSRLYDEYRILDFSSINNISREDYDFNNKLLFDCFHILNEIGKKGDPSTPTTMLTFQVVTSGLINENRYKEVQLNLKEWQSLAKGNDEIITLRKVLRIYTGFNEEDL